MSAAARVALVLAVLPGCLSTGPSVASGPPSDLSGLEVKLEPDREAYRPYQPIRLTLELRNSGSEPLLLRFPTAQRYDFSIVDAAGTVRWQWSDNRGFRPQDTEERLDPQQTATWRATFEGVLAPGSYRAEGIVLAEGQELRISVPIEVRTRPVKEGREDGS